MLVSPSPSPQVTVVDAAAAAEQLRSAESLAERRLAAGPGDARAVADLVVDQIEFADTLVLNKCDLLPQVRGGAGLRLQRPLCQKKRRWSVWSAAK